MTIKRVTILMDDKHINVDIDAEILELHSSNEARAKFIAREIAVYVACALESGEKE